MYRFYRIEKVFEEILRRIKALCVEVVMTTWMTIIVGLN